MRLIILSVLYIVGVSDSFLIACSRIPKSVENLADFRLYGSEQLVPESSPSRLATPSSRFLKNIAALSLAIALPSIHGVLPALSDVLTADEVIRLDITPKIQYLKDCLLIIRSLADFIDQKDYTSLRSALREGQISSLRATCRKTVQYLPTKEIQTKFNRAYNVMIETLNDFDTVLYLYD